MGAALVYQTFVDQGLDGPYDRVLGRLENVGVQNQVSGNLTLSVVLDRRRGSDRPRPASC